MDLKIEHGIGIVLQCNNCKRYGKKEKTGMPWCYLEMGPTMPHLHCEYYVMNEDIINSAIKKHDEKYR